MCRLLNVSPEKLQEIKKNVQIGQVQSLSEVLGGEDGELTIEDTIASDQEPEEDAIRNAVRKDQRGRAEKSRPRTYRLEEIRGISRECGLEEK